MHPDYLRELVLNKRKSGFTLRQISDDLNISMSTAKTLYSYKKKIQKKKTGPKCKVDKRLSLQLKRYITKQNDNGSKVSCRKIVTENNISISRRTVNNWLLRNKFKYRKFSQKLQLSSKHKLDRIDTVSSWIQRNIQWENTVFSDEKRFCLDGPDNWFTIIIYLYI